MKNSLLTIVLLSSLIFTVSSFTLQLSKTTDYKSEIEAPREDYGCVHDDHSQYDDGDSLNLKYLNDNYNEINGGT